MGYKSVGVEAHVARPVVDPALAPLVQRWVLRLIARKNQPAKKLLVERAGPIALTMCVLTAAANHLTGAWLATVALVAWATFAVRREVRFAGLRRYRKRFVDAVDLDEAGAQRLGAAQTAIEAVLTSEVYLTGRLDSPVREADLRQHEWEIAWRLLGITKRRAEYLGDLSEGVPGPRSAAVLHGHARAIAIAEEATTRRVEELQRFASEAQASDLALHDLRTAEKLALKNALYLDLVAATAADEHATTEVASLTDDAAQAREVYQAALDRAMQAAGPLALSLPE